MPLLNTALKLPPSVLRFAGKQRVLIVDDDPIIRATNRRFLQQYNTELPEDRFETTLAKDGQDGLEKAEQAEAEGHPFAVMITDNDMPRKKGVELIRDVVQLKFKPFIAMISSDDVETEAREAGANAFHTKPARKETIRSIMQQYQGLLTCPLPESRPVRRPTLGNLPKMATESHIKTTLPRLNNPFENAFAESLKPVPEEDGEQSAQSVAKALETLQHQGPRRKSSNASSKKHVSFKDAFP